MKGGLKMLPKATGRGFTIVELLIVIVVIGILAAITIVAYNGIQDRAQVAAIKSDLDNFAKTVEIAHLSTTDGNYPTTLTSAMNFHVIKSDYLANRNNWYYCVSTDHTQYALGVVSLKNIGYIVSSTGPLQENVTVDDAHVCPVVGKVNGSQMGYAWNGSSGTWQSWTN